jgi:hypothetical protein
MSIDISSAIPMFHTADIKISKDEESRKTRPVEGSSESDNASLRMKKEGFSETIVRDNLIGVGETYSTRGELVKEAKSSRNGGNSSIMIDMII